jgi:hypothetical protein
MPRKPIVFYTEEEKEDRIQRLRNRIPTVIVELIISFIVPLSNFHYMKSIIQSLSPFDFQENKSTMMLDLINTFKKVGSLIQRPFEKPFEFSYLHNNCWYLNQYSDDNRKLHNEYEITIKKIEKVIEYFKEHETSTKNVFYTRNIELIENECDSKMPLQVFIQLFYRLKCPGFLLAYAHEPYLAHKRSIINFKITTKDKKKVINFFKGLGKLIDWMKHTVPIIYEECDDRWMKMGYGYKMMIDDAVLTNDGITHNYIPESWIQNRAYDREY